jgi:hypothetical protein
VAWRSGVAQWRGAVAWRSGVAQWRGAEAVTMMNSICISTVISDTIPSNFLDTEKYQY